MEIKEIFKRYGIELNENQIWQFEEYYRFLVEENEKYNLTAITEKEEVFFKHFLDSALGEKFIDKNALVIDIGSGAGFPAIPLKIVRPDLKFVLVDCDRVEFSNLNRQILFSSEDVDLRKVDIAASFLGALTDGIEAISHNEKISEENVEEVLGSHRIDFIIDAVDDVKGKVALIKYAHNHNIPIVVSVGMGNRLDPTLIEILPLDKTTDDPLAKALRHQCRENGIDCSSVMTVHSKEHPLMKSETPNSMIMVPSAAGLFICYYVVKYFMNEEEN